MYEVYPAGACVNHLVLSADGLLKTFLYTFKIEMQLHHFRPSLFFLPAPPESLIQLLL